MSININEYLDKIEDITNEIVSDNCYAHETVDVIKQLMNIQTEIKKINNILNSGFLKGDKGDKGDKCDKGDKGDKGDTCSHSMFIKDNNVALDSTWSSNKINNLHQEGINKVNSLDKKITTLDNTTFKTKDIEKYVYDVPISPIPTWRYSASHIRVTFGVSNINMILTCETDFITPDNNENKLLTNVLPTQLRPKDSFYTVVLLTKSGKPVSNAKCYVDKSGSVEIIYNSVTTGCDGFILNINYIINNASLDDMITLEKHKK